MLYSTEWFWQLTWLLITWLDDFYSVLDDCIQQLSGHVLSRWRGTLSVTLTRSTLYFTLSYFYKNQSTECTDKHCDINFKDVYYSLHFSILDNVSGKTIAFFQKYIINVIINIFQIYACFIFCIFTEKLTKKADFKEILVLRKLHRKFSIPVLLTVSYIVYEYFIDRAKMNLRLMSPGPRIMRQVLDLRKLDA